MEIKERRLLWTVAIIEGVLGGANESACQCRRHETWVQSLNGEDPLEKEMATHSSVLAWKNPMGRGAWYAGLWGCKESGMTKHMSAAAVIIESFMEAVE